MNAPLGRTPACECARWHGKNAHGGKRHCQRPATRTVTIEGNGKTYEQPLCDECFAVVLPPEKNLGRCECRDEGCPAKDRHIVAGEGPRAGEFVPCRAHAVRLVTVDCERDKFGVPQKPAYRFPACEPCAAFHEGRASHTERTTEKGGRE